MDPKDNFQHQINLVSKNDWEKLFSLIPDLEQSKTFGELKGGREVQPGTIQMPYWKWSDVVSKFVKIMYDLNLVIHFDWGAWKEGFGLLNDDKTNFEKLDTVTLCKLLTTLIRADRFNDGLLVINFENGKILKIVRALKNKIIMRK